MGLGHLWGQETSQGGFGTSLGTAEVSLWVWDISGDQGGPSVGLVTSLGTEEVSLCVWGHLW